MARRAILLIGIKTYLRHGFILQMTVWRLPGATSERTHGLKYSLFFGARANASSDMTTKPERVTIGIIATM